MSKHKSMLALWVACCAILMAALAPSVSHLLASRDGMPSMMAEICSAAGMATVAIDQDGAIKKPSAPGSAMNMADCPYCTLHADLPALPPIASPVLALNVLTTTAPRLFYHSPTPLFSWAPPQSRAPPTIS